MEKIIKHLITAIFVGLCLSSFEFTPNQKIGLTILISTIMMSLFCIEDELKKNNKK